ncbi:cytochrome P450 [Chengkuizengella marina]|uniref:Cytochrome P450 n=1 Tax=Chengkuizengella marina TaxID=2507566 RepID=A0A6N9Q5B7_9BACL|nr:cytochrome P450 [Chengkuizengella marina]NBI29960.1 cytochrome P450 [Chengkuizengella marina]
MENTGEEQMKEGQIRLDKWDPFEWYKQKRENEPIYFDEKSGQWNAFLYDDVSYILSNYEQFSSARYQAEERDPFGNSLLFIDPPKHKQMRDLVNKSFTPKVMRSWEPRIEYISDTLIEDMIEKTTIELVNDFSMPLPVIVIANMLGVPTEELHLFKKWSDQMVEGDYNASEEEIKITREKYVNTMKELFHYFSEIINHKKNHLQEDIISILLQAEVDGKKVSDEELIGFCILLLVAGNETTTNLITNAVYTLLDEQDSFYKLKQNLQLLPSAIEEVLRHRSPIQSMNRKVKKDMEFRGVQLKEGDLINAFIGSANRDESKFLQADQFMIDRDPNHHIAFGSGIHFCLGAPLARMEARIALKKLIESFPNMHFSDDMEIQPINSMVVYGLKKLPIQK